MDTNLDDSLNLDSDMGVDFDSSQDIVVHQDDMTLEGSGHESLPMEFEQIEEQPALMDTGNEEIIVSDFMGDQFSLQEYQIQDESLNVNPKIEPTENVFTSEGEIYQDLQLGQHVMVPTSGVFSDTFQAKPKIVSVKAALPAMRAIAPKKQTVVVTKAIAPKQIAIAPKPPKLVTGTMKLPRIGKQFTIAPKPLTGVKPVTIIANKTGQVVKKLTIPTSQDSATGNSVLAIGKQLVMLPSGVGTGQKLKLVTSGGKQAVRLLAAHSPDKTQLISAQSVTGQQNPKQMMTKVVVQGSSSADQSAVLTKLGGAAGAGAGAGAGGGLVTGTGSGARFVMTPKTVPISLSGTKVVLGSPTKAGIRFTTAKKQQIVLKTPPSNDGMATKKIVLTANPTQGVAIKPALAPASPATATATVSANKQDLVKKVPLGQKAQLHQINVPGKGVQYIRLVTNMGQAKQVVQAPKSSPNKTFVLTDSKGNRIQMEKVSPQPPPLIVTSGAPPPALHETKVSPRPKLVKIAPVWSKQGQAAMSRGGKSLLAPLTPAAAPAHAHTRALEPEPVALIEAGRPQSPAEEHGYSERTQLEELTLDNEPQVCNSVDSKAALRQLIADTVGSDDAQESAPHDARAPGHIDSLYHNENSQYENGISLEQLQQSQRPDHPLIVIPSYMKQDRLEDSGDYNNVHDNSRNSPPEVESHYAQRQNSLVNIEVEPLEPYPPDRSPEGGENDSGGELDLRPRKACNCTKSQCLKLYCDCFANGGFCHRCNCTNCHNNLENEQLRQKAIKGCLDRNPNAFRPKIGKSKTGGPETFRRHKKGCNCKRSGCLKNYCECYEAKIACTSICRCVGCRNVEESVERARRREARLAPPPPPQALGPAPPAKQPCSFMTSEVIEAVCQCLIAAAVDSPAPDGMDGVDDKDPIRDVIDEFARCLQDIISASNQATPLAMFDEAQV